MQTHYTTTHYISQMTCVSVLHSHWLKLIPEELYGRPLINNNNNNNKQTNIFIYIYIIHSADKHSFHIHLHYTFS